MELTRRRLVGAGSLATLSALAGCLDDGGRPAGGTGDGDGNGNGDDDTGSGGNGNGSDDGGDQSDDDDENQSDGGNQSEDVDGTRDEDGGSSESMGGGTDTTEGDQYASLAFATSSVPETDADPLYSADEARRTLPLDEWEEGTRDRVDSFLAETDFETSAILALRTRAPNHCYEFVLNRAAIDDGSVTVRAAAVDDDAQGACAQAEKGLWLLVRFTAEDGVPEEGNVTIVDADGNEHGFGYAGESASASAGDGSTDNGSDDGDQSRLGSFFSR